MNNRAGFGGRSDVIVAVIPAFNQDRLIGSVVLKLKPFVDYVIVVDDGSADATAAVAWEAGADVVAHHRSQGTAAAVQSGFERAIALEAAGVILVSGEAGLNPRNVRSVVQPILDGTVDVVVSTPCQMLESPSVLQQMSDSVPEGVEAFSASELLHKDEGGFRAFSVRALHLLNGSSLEIDFERKAHDLGLKVARLPEIKPDGEQGQVRGAYHPFRAGIKKIKRAKKIENTVVIPVYNEEEALPHVLESLGGIVDDSYEILVVDDGSTDESYAVAAAYGCRVLSHQTNRGKGAAMQTAIRHARGDKVVFIDGDATYPVQAIPKICSELDNCDLVRAVRHDGREHIPPLNRFGNKVFEWIIHSVHRVDSVDALTGLYGLRRETLQRMQLEADGFDIESEIVIKVGALGLRSRAIPVPYHERIGEKKLRPVHDGVRILTRILALAVTFNPFVTYVLPGLALWSVAALVLLFFIGNEPTLLPFNASKTNALVISTMTFLGGFQLVTFGLVANLYAAETGLTVPSRSLYYVARHLPRLLGAALSVVMIAGGITASIATVLMSGSTALGNRTEVLILSLLLVVWGVQLLGTMFFLSLFANLTKFKP